MRIVGGRLRGRPLVGPATPAIRPTSDRLRETIFNVLAHRFDDPVAGARVLDLFAGTGALALEALSRGAVRAVLVDSGSEARSLAGRNIEALGLSSLARLLRADATRLGPAAADGGFDLVFCDPPYGHDLAPAALAGCAAGGWLLPGALVVVEESVGAGFRLPAGFAELDRRAVGDSAVVFGLFGKV